jgi:hypothetical protein
LLSRSPYSSRRANDGPPRANARPHGGRCRHAPESRVPRGDHRKVPLSSAAEPDPHGCYHVRRSVRARCSFEVPSGFLLKSRCPKSSRVRESTAPKTGPVTEMTGARCTCCSHVSEARTDGPTRTPAMDLLRPVRSDHSARPNGSWRAKRRESIPCCEPRTDTRSTRLGEGGLRFKRNFVKQARAGRRRFENNRRDRGGLWLGCAPL